MKLSHIQEASYYNRGMNVWELWFHSGGRGGLADSEFGYEEHLNVSELPEHLYDNLAWNNTHMVYDNAADIIDEAEEMLGYAVEADNAGADIINPNKDFQKFVRAASKASGVAVSQFVDDLEIMWVTDISRKDLIHLVTEKHSTDSNSPSTLDYALKAMNK